MSEKTYTFTKFIFKNILFIIILGMIIANFKNLTIIDMNTIVTIGYIVLILGFIIYKSYNSNKLQSLVNENRERYQPKPSFFNRKVSAVIPKKNVCLKCGQNYLSGDVFCNGCGSRIET